MKHVKIENVGQATVRLSAEKPTGKNRFVLNRLPGVRLPPPQEVFFITTDPLRRCPRCSKVLRRKKKESESNWRRRVHCGNVCARVNRGKWNLSKPIH